MFLIYYIVIVDTDKDGILVGGPYFGGDVADQATAEKIASDLNNDRTMPRTVIVKISQYTDRKQNINIINKYFNNMIRNIYEQERMMNR